MMKTDHLIMWAIEDGSLPGGKKATTVPIDKKGWIALVDAWFADGMLCRPGNPTGDKDIQKKDEAKI